MSNYYSEAVEAKAIALASEYQIVRSGGRSNRSSMLRSRATVDVLAKADSYWMSADIWQAIISSSEHLPMDFVLSVDLPHTTHGWLWFEKPWQLPGATMHERQHPENEIVPAACAIAWGVGARESDRSPVLTVESFHRGAGGMLLPLYYTFALPGINVESEESRRRDELVGLGRAVDVQPLHAMMRAILSTFLWLKQSIVKSAPVHLERHAQKRIARVEMEKSLNVITLRRAASVYNNEQGAEPVEWTCRWLVRGHWRQQYHPSTGRREPIYILPHVKGPEDKPFRPSAPSVFAVTR